MLSALGPRGGTGRRAVAYRVASPGRPRASDFVPAGGVSSALTGVGSASRECVVDRALIRHISASIWAVGLTRSSVRGIGCREERIWRQLAGGHSAQEGWHRPILTRWSTGSRADM